MTQNAAARVVTKTGKFVHISGKLRDLKWLSGAYRIKNISWICSHGSPKLNGQAPEYISDLITERVYGIDIRIGKSKVLEIPTTVGTKDSGKLTFANWYSLIS